jgi:phosphotransferase system HPr (HPr) family protein
MTSRVVAISNPLGLHARAAARFVHAASAFHSMIRVGREGRVMDGKSIMGILLLAASQGTEITITAEGPDETAAVEVLCALVERGFEEAPFDPAQRGPFGGAQGGPCA